MHNQAGRKLKMFAESSITLLENRWNAWIEATKPTNVFAEYSTCSDLNGRYVIYSIAAFYDSIAVVPKLS